MTQPFVSPFGVPDDDVEAAEFAAAQQAEYSKWEAAQVITHGNATAYLEGHPIPVGNVERLGYAKRGQARLQFDFIERNPEDADVQRFMAFAERYPDHPDVRKYNAEVERRKAAEVDREPEMPNPFADEDGDGVPDGESAAESGTAGAKSPTKAAKRAAAAGKPGESAGETAGDGRTATNTASEG